jgi:electron transport complex protein RnfB
MEGVRALAKLLGVSLKPLDASRGTEKPPAVAVIDEVACIGCARCIPACPVDAILGAAKHMHTVLIEECTGCERCLPVCPVDCIRMEPLAACRTAGDRDRFRRRYEARQTRQEREKSERLAAAQRMKAALCRRVDQPPPV